MSAGGSIAAMISSMKSNNRRKNKHKPFSKYDKTYKKTSPIKSKEYSQLEKDLLSKKLKENKIHEKEQHLYKLLISIGLTVIVIAGIVFLVKFVFF